MTRSAKKNPSVANLSYHAYLVLSLADLKASHVDGCWAQEEVTLHDRRQLPDDAAFHCPDVSAVHESLAVRKRYLESTAAYMTVTMQESPRTCSDIPHYAGQLAQAHEE
jgi:hypothetical protein